jgi:DNA-binding NarL/FixJ family response regulator
VNRNPQAVSANNGAAERIYFLFFTTTDNFNKRTKKRTYKMELQVEQTLPQEKFQGQAPLFTEGEMAVLKMVGEGLTNAQIATALKTSVRTIETRRSSLIEKSNTVNTATLIKYAVKNGFID